MLVLSRRRGEALYLIQPDGTRACIRINDVRGNQVSVGIDAPDDVQILREELLEPSMMKERTK